MDNFLCHHGRLAVDCTSCDGPPYLLPFPQETFMSKPTSDRNVDVGRRDFLKTSAVVATAATTLGSVPFVHAAPGDDVLKIGLVGCGGRGTGAAEQALRADPRVRLVAMADAFRDRLDSSLAGLRRN